VDIQGKNLSPSLRIWGVGIDYLFVNTFSCLTNFARNVSCLLINGVLDHADHKFYVRHMNANFKDKFKGSVVNNFNKAINLQFESFNSFNMLLTDFKSINMM